MIMDDNEGQMIFGDLGGLKLLDVRLTGEEKPRKTSLRKLFPTEDRTRARCITGAHAVACPTAVDTCFYCQDITFMYRQYSTVIFITFCQMFGKRRTPSARPSF